MAAVLQQVKKGIYIFAASVALLLLGVRAVNVLQKNNYATEPLKNTGSDVQIFLSFPKVIQSSKTETLYPLTITFINQSHPQPAVDYDFSFESSSLIFTDAAGKDVDQHVKISSDYSSIEKRIFIRSSPSGGYPVRHEINIMVEKGGQPLGTTPETVTIPSESKFFSYFTLIASSILEISIVLGLATLVTKALDDEQKARRDLMDQRRAEIQKVMSLPLLVRMRQYLELRDKQRKEQWDEELNDEFVAKQAVFSGPAAEQELLQVVGEYLVQGRQNELTDLDVLYGRFYTLHKQSIDVLANIIRKQDLKEEPLWLVSQIVMLWDDFDAAVKDLIVVALVLLSQKVDLSKISGDLLKKETFYDNGKTKRLRLLRSVELRAVFPQLNTPPTDYDATWFHQKSPEENPKVSAWLKQHYLLSNPFGGYDLRDYPFFPSGAHRPDQWPSFLSSTPSFAHCPSAEDVQPLAFRLRNECIQLGEANKTIHIRQNTFPVVVAHIQQTYLQQPLVTLAHAVSQSWLNILPMSPDALLDLPIVSQDSLLNLICWSLGSKYAAINILRQRLPGENAACRLLKSKFSDFNCQFSSTIQPPDVILLSWLRIRPPDMERTFLILVDDERPHSTLGQWFQYFSPLIPHLTLDGVMTKVISSTHLPYANSISTIEFTWFDNDHKAIKRYLDGQFDAAMDPVEISLGKAISFHELFGPGSSPEHTTDKLIAASQCSLAQLLRLGNRLFQNHCNADKPEKYLSPEELDDILLKS